jgi:thiamine-monophosphate kinase
MRELDLIRTIAGLAPSENRLVVKGIGDDCAVFRSEPGMDWVTTADMMVEGVHFDLSWHGPYQLGRKAIAVNLSDIAAMGATPQFSLLCLGVPPGVDQAWLSAFLAGFCSLLGEHNCSLIGGDTISSKDLSVSVTVLGTVPSSGALLRTGARTGDTVYVSGPLGSAAAGLRLCEQGWATHAAEDQSEYGPLVSCHLEPIPRVKLGKLLRQSGLVTALQDVSDGVATDLSHICTASGVGAVIEERSLPYHPVLLQLCRRRQWDMTRLQISGGEDYELLFTVRNGAERELEEFLALSWDQPICRIGRIVDDAFVSMRTRSGELVDISYQGYQHL